MLAGQQEAAFQAARLHDAMPVFVDGLPPSGAAAQEGCEWACLFYEERALWEASAELRDRFGDPEAAVKLYMKVLVSAGHPLTQTHKLQAAANDADSPAAVRAFSRATLKRRK